MNTKMIDLKAGKNRVEFLSVNDKIVGNIYCPDELDSEKVYPTIIAAGPLATVKEQAGGVFAEKLAKRGFITIAFDYRTFGESEGEPRCYENPSSKTEDIQNAISFMSTLKNVDSSKIGALGICASASYISASLISEKRVKAFATVAGYFNIQEYVAYNPMISDEQRENLFMISNQARQKYYSTGVAERNDMMLSESIGDNPDPFSQDIYNYYFTKVETHWPNYSNQLTVFSFEQLARFNALKYAELITTPYLGIVGSKAVSVPQTLQFVESKPGENTVKYIEGARHIQSYDNAAYVTEAVDHLEEFYNDILSK